MTTIKHRLEGVSMDAPAHVYTVFIRATPERVWQAITDGADTERYYYGTRVASDWQVGRRSPTPIPRAVAADGKVLEIDSAQAPAHDVPRAVGSGRGERPPDPPPLGDRT
jgi:hypothetical protein